MLPELKLALTKYGNARGWKGLKPGNQLGLNAKQQQGYSCTFYRNGVAVKETLNAPPQSTPSIATTTPSPSPTIAATAAPTKTVEITRKTR